MTHKVHELWFGSKVVLGTKKRIPVAHKWFVLVKNTVLKASLVSTIQRKMKLQPRMAVAILYLKLITSLACSAKNPSALPAALVIIPRKKLLKNGGFLLKKM
jgi:hypothetical protein